MTPSRSSRRAAWREMCTEVLPSLARARSAAQRRWPVTLDHCFGRIILDSVVGGGEEAWDRRLARPAVQNMSAEQLEACIELGQRIATGKADLVALDEQSLAARGKKSKVAAKTAKTTKAVTGTKGGRGEGRQQQQQQQQQQQRKRQRGEAPDAAETESQPPSKQLRGSEDDDLRSEYGSRDGRETDTRRDYESSDRAPEREEEDGVTTRDSGDLSVAEMETLIKSSSLAPYRKRVLLAMSQIPKGEFSTYLAISDFLKSSPRAVGNNVRNNPFAPAVPCHRVLASDGKIGGYCSQWAEGDLIDKKRKLLREEGVKFDGKGKVVGRPWKGFK